MTIILTLFFISLFGITFMIGRKLVMLQNGKVISGEKVLLEIPYIKEIKHITIKNIKKHHHAGLVATIRFYVRFSNFLKNKYQEAKIKIKNRNKESHIGSEKKEISKFLKIISEYKHKIREIKHKIKKEEENNL